MKSKSVEKGEKREKILEKLFGWLMLIAILTVCGFSLNIPQHFYWQKKPGSLFEKQHYTTVVYVKVYPQLTGDKHYWLKGAVERDNTCNTNFELYDNSLPCTLAYNLEAFKWPNGGIAYFDSCDIDFSLVRVPESPGCDSDDNPSHTYYIQLTNELAK